MKFYLFSKILIFLKILELIYSEAEGLNVEREVTGVIQYIVCTQKPGLKYFIF